MIGLSNPEVRNRLARLPVPRLPAGERVPLVRVADRRVVIHERTGVGTLHYALRLVYAQTALPTVPSERGSSPTRP